MALASSVRVADAVREPRGAGLPPMGSARGSFFARAIAAAARGLDGTISFFAPRAGFRRTAWREARAQYYEGTQQTRLRKLAFTNPSGDGVTYGNVMNLRAVARDLERNHDIARGVLDVLVRNVVGTGIQIEPHPRDKDGNLLTDLARDLRTEFRQWAKRPEVTRELSWGMTQRLHARGWLRDGEALLQHVEGRVAGLRHSTGVPYSIELLEADMLTDWLTDPARLIMQGVQRDKWGKPTTYYIFKGNPGDLFIAPRSLEAKPVDARRISHLKIMDRVRQARGVSIFASVITRLEDLKDYETSERIAAKVAASMAAAIIKGLPDAYNTNGVGATKDSDTGARELKFAPGMIFDDLRPGEDVKVIDTKRPNSSLAAHRDGQLRAVAAGTSSGYSAISRNYNGTYSAQRQELVEQWGAYGILSEHFTAQAVEPVWSRFVNMAVTAGRVKLPPTIDLRTLTDALFLAPQMPWIDPLKEANAFLVLEAGGFASAPEIIRRRGQNPDDVVEQEAAWQRRRQELEIVEPPEKVTIRSALRERARARGFHAYEEELRNGSES